tara:strand:+ start:432 stop:704 length:273 start_codon:yes stop_codon:yes gene_type:complete
MQELLLNMYKQQYDGDEEKALEAYNNHLDDTEDALKVYYHGYLEESEFSKEDFKMLPKIILNLIAFMVKESEQNYTFRENVEAWIEDRPF